MSVYHTDAGPVETLEWGEGDEVFILAHAAAAGPGSLAGLAKALMRPGRRIVAPALNGYGGTLLRGVTGVAAHVAVLNSVFAMVPARRRVLFGHSMGGLAALLTRGWAQKLILFEPIVTAVLRADDPWDRAGRDWDRGIVAAFDAAMAKGEAERAVLTFIEAWNGGRWSDLPARTRSALVETAADLGRDMNDVSFYALGSIDPPADVLILRGDRSPEVTARMTGRLAERIPGARRAVVAGCGHMGPARSPEIVAEWFTRS